MKRDQLRALMLVEIMKSDVALENAFLLIWHRQTRDEQQQGVTTHQNGIGFNGPDANMASYCANWLLDPHGVRIPHRHLTGRFLRWAQRVMPKYTGQLVDIAAEIAKVKEAEDKAKDAAYEAEERLGLQQF